MSVLEFNEVTRRYGDVVALNRVTLDLDPGILAMVGPNGAGKSTFMKIATGHVKPTGGSVKAFGEPIWDNPRVMARLGFVPEQDAFYEHMSGLEFVARLAQLNNLSKEQADRRAYDELKLLGLDEGMDRPIRDYSKGMRQRVKLAQALVHEPELLFLDEPLLGCDPVARRRIQERISTLAKNGTTILVSSHILPEMEKLTRQIAFMSGGRLIARGNAGAVRDMLSQIPSRIRVGTPVPRKVASAVSKWELVGSVRITHDSVELETEQMKNLLAQLQHECKPEWKVRGIETLDADLQSLFGYLAGESA